MALAAGALLAALAVAATGGSPFARRGTLELPPGRWSGDVTAGDGTVGLWFDVGVADGRPSLRVLGLTAHGISQRTMEGVVVGAETLSFRWPGRVPRHCTLWADTARGVLSGGCRGGSGQPWRVRMAPPGSEAPMGMTARLLAGAEWRTTERGGLRVHLLPGAVTAAEEAQLLDDAEAGLRRAEERIGGRVGRVIDVFAVADRSELERLTGLTYSGYADPLSATVVITGHGRGWRALHHEIMHVVSAQLWGVPAAPDGWLLEGLGTLAMQQCAGRDFDALAAHLLEARRLPPLPSLIEEFHSLDDVVSYTAAASLVGWTWDHHGRDAVQALWQHGLVGNTPGTTLAELETGWHRHLRTAVPAAPADFDRIRAHGCDEPGDQLVPVAGRSR